MYRKLSISGLKVYPKTRKLQNIYNLKAFHKKDRKYQVEKSRLKIQKAHNKKAYNKLKQRGSTKYLTNKYNCTID